MSVLAPPPQDELELELLIREARARQRRRRLIGAAAVAIWAAAGLSLWAAIPGLGGRNGGSGGGPRATSARSVDNSGRVQISEVGTSGGVTWAIDNKGMWLTTDGGRAWRAAIPATIRRLGLVSQHISQVTFVDRRHGWLYSGNVASNSAPLARSALFRTSDGGRSWQRATPKGCCGDLSFVDDRLGFLAGPRGLYETRNGGASWTRIGSQGSGEPLFLDARRGVLLLDGGILRTADGGRRWTSILLSGQPPAAGNKTVVMGSLAAAGHRLVLISERDFAAKMYPGDWRTIPYFSDDGGASWTRRPTPKGWVPYIGSSDGNLLSAPTANGWVAAARHELAVTTDAGLTWRIVHVAGVPKRWVIGSIDFTSLRVGWAIFDGPKQSYLMRTTDGGSHWAPAGPKARRAKHA
ncbi:MAG TPA: hypothetical protein VFA37_03985 [Gaiellaceae bacterium]|nr:hypothetical protein [Gaiellaceae bacterium]